MNFLNKSNKYLQYLMLIIAVISTRLPILNFTIFISIFISFLLLMYIKTNFNRGSVYLPVKLYTIYILIQIFRSLLISDNYWAFKSVFTTSICLLYVIIIYFLDNPVKLMYIYRKWFKYIIYLTPLFLPFMDSSSRGIFFAPILILLLTFNFLDRRWKLIVFLLTLICFSDFSARSIILKYSFAIILVLLYYIYPKIKRNLLSFMSVIMFLIPIIFFTLSITTNFNIFNLEKYAKKDIYQKKVVNGQIIQEDLLADTRTEIFTSVLNNIHLNNQIWFGKGPGYGVAFDDFGDFDNLGGVGRDKNEIGVVNLFMWTGIIGVVLWSFLVFRAVQLALFKSNNYSVKIFGVYLVFRWIIFWIEDIQDYYIDNIVLYSIIAICYSEKFRNITNLEFKFWINKLIK